jgi:hypothetical protein
LDMDSEEKEPGSCAMSTAKWTVRDRWTPSVLIDVRAPATRVCGRQVNTGIVVWWSSLKSVGDEVEQI